MACKPTATFWFPLAEQPMAKRPIAVLLNTEKPEVPMQAKAF